MAGTQEKIQLLLKIAHRLNEAGVEWALGASMMLYFKDITSDFHDIDLMVVDRDAECVRTILSEMGESFPSASIPNPMYRAKTFMEFFIDSVEVDVMAGFAIVKDGKLYASLVCLSENRKSEIFSGGYKDGWKNLSCRVNRF